MFFCLHTQAQDLAKIEYTYLPEGGKATHFERLKIAANIPFKLDKKGTYLVIGLEYRNSNIGLKEEVPFAITNLEHYQMYGVNAGYSFKLKNDWRFAIRLGARISSNFETSIVSDDFRYSGDFVFVKSKKEIDKPWRIVLGMQYSNPGTLNFPLPIINYYKKFHERWSFNIGTPKTNLKYHFDERNTIQAYALVDRFYANVQKNRNFLGEADGSSQIANISSLRVVGGLGYEYAITEHLLLYLYAGHTLNNDLRLRDENRNDVYTINNSNSFFARGGIKFKI